MKKIRHIATLLLIITVLAHVGCMNSSSPSRGGLSGLVTDSSGLPLSGVRVSTGTDATFTDVYGRWLIEGLEPQLMQVTAAREKFQTQSLTVEVVSGETIDDINFALPADSEIYDIQVTGITSGMARITFYTKFQAKGSVHYGADALLDKNTPVDAELGFLHQYELTGLMPATTYRFKCLVIDKAGRSLESEIRTFNTPATSRGLPPTGLSITKSASSNAVNLTWNADTGADFAGYRVYRSEAAQGIFSLLGSGQNLQNSYLDASVKPGVKYYYRLTRISGSGDESAPSQVAAFLVPGVMTENAVWTSQESPYHLSGDLTVGPNASLIIDKGVTVAVSRGDQWSDDLDDTTVELVVQGTLMIQGSSIQPVTFTSAAVSPQPGDWNGIRFDTVSDLGASLIKGLNLSFAETGIDGLAGLPEVRDAKISSCRVAAVKSRNARRDLLVRGVTVETCGSGLDLRDNPVKVQVLENTISRCIYGIIARDNKLVEIESNRIRFSGAVGIDAGNTETASKIRLNLVGHGSSGVGIICRKFDEVRRNTLHASIGIEIKENAQGSIRSNLILADNGRNGVGIMYSGSSAYDPATASLVQYNGIWNVSAGRKYVNADGSSMAGYSGDVNFSLLAGPGLQGGDPFEDPLDQNFSYVPSSGSPLKGAGYDYETVGAEDVPE